MKPLIIEKEGSIIIYLDAYTITTVDNIANLIDESFPECVIEIAHNRKTQQGSIILSKICSESIDKIKELLL